MMLSSSSRKLTKRTLLRFADRTTAQPCRTIVCVSAVNRTSQSTVASSLSNAPIVLATMLLSPLQEAVPSSSPLNLFYYRSRRCFSSSADDIKKTLDEFQDLFVEARLCIEDVQDSVGTTYYEEDAEAAQEAVDEAVTAFETLVEGIEDVDEKNRVLRGNGLKVEQLKGELEMALKGGHDHH